MTATQLAKLFHETYERLAPHFDYKTREASAVPWNEVPEQNRNLMVAVSEVVLSLIKNEKEVYSDPECIYQYCPYPNECKFHVTCEHKRVQ